MKKSVFAQHPNKTSDHLNCIFRIQTSERLGSNLQPAPPIINLKLATTSSRPPGTGSFRSCWHVAKTQMTLTTLNFLDLSPRNANSSGNELKKILPDLNASHSSSISASLPYFTYIFSKCHPSTISHSPSDIGHRLGIQGRYLWYQELHRFFKDLTEGHLKDLEKKTCSKEILRTWWCSSEWSLYNMIRYI